MPRHIFNHVVDQSTTVTAGGTAQDVIAANDSRRGFCLQNNSAADLWFSDVGTAAAAQPSLRLPAGSYYETPVGAANGNAVSVFGTVTGQALTAREW